MRLEQAPSSTNRTREAETKDFLFCEQVQKYPNIASIGRGSPDIPSGLQHKLASAAALHFLLQVGTFVFLTKLEK